MWVAFNCRHSCITFSHFCQALIDMQKEMRGSKVWAYQLVTLCPDVVWRLQSCNRTHNSLRCSRSVSAQNRNENVHFAPSAWNNLCLGNTNDLLNFCKNVSIIGQCICRLLQLMHDDPQLLFFCTQMYKKAKHHDSNALAEPQKYNLLQALRQVKLKHTLRTTSTQE